MHADTTAYQQPGIAFSGISRHTLKRLAIEQGDRQLNTHFRGLRLGDAQMQLEICARPLSIISSCSASCSLKRNTLEAFSERTSTMPLNTL